MRLSRPSVLVALAGVCAVASAPAWAQSSPVVETSAAVQHDVSPALRELLSTPE